MNKILVTVSLSVGTFFLAGSSVLAATATIEGNGAKSHNTVSVSSTCISKSYQTNVSSISNSVVVGANTGDNSISKNVGGSSAITTGDVTQTVDITNNAGVNMLDAQDPCCSCSTPGDTLISENGYGSKNKATSSQKKTSKQSQTNVSQIGNGVVVGGNTGGNKSDKNVKGNKEISTGMVDTLVTITNNTGLNTNGLSL
jgi:hypothetical protein